MIGWCKRWWKACGKKVPKGTRVAVLRKQILKWRQELMDSPSSNIIIGKGCKPLPWRLSVHAAQEVDRRVCNIVYPHGVNGCSKDDVGFLLKSGRTWRTADKLTALLCILPTVLRGYVHAVRVGVRKVIWALRILQVHTHTRAHNARCTNTITHLHTHTRRGVVSTHSNLSI